MELPDIKEFNKIGYSIAVVVYIHKFMRPFLSTSAASIRYNQSKHNKTWDICVMQIVLGREWQ